jgi:hypothetical protein
MLPIPSSPDRKIGAREVKNPRTANAGKAAIEATLNPVAQPARRPAQHRSSGVSA